MLSVHVCTTYISISFRLQLTSAGADDVTLREVALNACDILLSCGFTKPIATLKHQDVSLRL